MPEQVSGALAPAHPLEPVRLGDTDLHVVPEVDEAGGPDAIVPGFGGTLRDGLGVRAGRGGVELAIVGGLVVDPVLGVRRTSIGISGGRVVAIGRAGNPDTMDDISVVLDPATAVLDAVGLVVTPGAIDPHVHWLSPQVASTALAGAITTLVIQDFGPVWNLGCNPAEGLAATWAALEAVPLNAALLVRGSSATRERVEQGLRAGAAGLKIHEDVAAGPAQIRTALDLCDEHDVQLAIHTDGLNEALSAADTLEAFGGRTVHAFHIEGVGGGHAPNLLDLAGEPNVLASSTSPTLPYGVHAVAEHLEMVSAVHVLDPHRRAGDREAVALRVRARTMAAEGVLHDLGVIPMMSSDSQGMGRIGEVVRRAFQTADAMKRVRGAEPGAADNERVLRYLAKLTINVAITHGLADDVGSLQRGRLADAVLWQPALFGVRPELVVKSGISAWGASGDGNATTMLAEPTRVGPQIGALGTNPARLSLAFLAGASMDAELPTSRPRARVRGCRGLTAADMVRNDRRGTVRVDPHGGPVTLDGEPVQAPAVGQVALSGRYLLG
ncbi:MAG TPA: urease subunit alpha [Solirubrobacteraceae bacterium]|nr:urease subunit alpha [Solirubrobacteraceae bacterium]